MKNPENTLETLRSYYLLAAADLVLYPKDTPEYHRAQYNAMEASTTVFMLFGADEAEALRLEGFKQYPALRKLCGMEE